MPKTQRSSSAKPAAKTTRAAKRPAAYPFEVRRSRIQGRGVFAIKPIASNRRLVEYVGQRITHEEADRRYDDHDGRHHTFLFILDDKTVLDARYGGSDARFINHSCDPNCESVITGGKIWIKSIKPIAVGEELTYDYRFEWDDDYEPEDIRYYACRCGTKKCRGTILRVPVYLRPTVKEWLAGNDVRKPRKPRRNTASAPTKKQATSRKKARRKATR